MDDTVVVSKHLDVHRDLANVNMINQHRNTVQVFQSPRDSKPMNHLKVQLKTLRGHTPVFIYPPDVDHMISSYVNDYGTWEQDLLNQTAMLTLKYPGITFLDLGCNIGVYSLFMSDLGANIIAVDPVIENLQLLSMSLASGRFHGNAVLVWNAVSNGYKTVAIEVPFGNVGGAHVVDMSVKNKNNVTTVSTILIDDLIPLVNGNTVGIKMDIEGHEANALQGAKTFFQTFDVKFVLMEFVHHRSKDSGRSIVDFLVRNGFMPYENINKNTFLNPSRYYNWPENTFWLKR